jgi:hypothetical protein
MQIVKNARLNRFLFHFSLSISNFLPAFVSFEHPIHKRKKSVALRTAAGGQGLGT